VEEALQMGDANEAHGEDDADTQADNHNNAIGALLGRDECDDPEDCLDACLEAYRRGELR
jgi:hypothetical protein